MDSAKTPEATRKCYVISTSWQDAAIPDHFRALSEALVSRGHKVILVVDGRRDDVVSWDTNPAICTWPSERPVRFADAVFLWRLIRQHRPACVVANFGATIVMIVVGCLMRVPARVAWYHTLSSQIDIDSGISRWRLRFLRFRMRAVYRLATHIAAVSRAAAEDVRRVFGVSSAKCKVLYNSLADPANWLDLNTASVNGPHRMVCAGRVCLSKGQDVLLEAVKILKGRLPDFSVEILGDGPSRRDFERLAQDLQVADRCCFVGAIPHRDTLRRMAAATLVVSPSRSDNLPTVGIEALAVGTPVVASDVGGIPEIVRDGNEGFLVPPGDPVVLADRLGVMLSDHALRERMSISARQRFLTQFERHRIVLEQARWLESLA